MNSKLLLSALLVAPLLGCPSKKANDVGEPPAPPSDRSGAPTAADPSTPGDEPAPPAHPTAKPVSGPKHKLPRTDPAGTKEAEAWDALGRRVGEWTRLLPSKLKDPSTREALEAPFRGDSAPALRLALLARYMPVEDSKAMRVLNIVGALRRVVQRDKALDPGLFDPEGPRAALWIGLMDPALILRTRLLKTPDGWASPEDVGRGAFDLVHARALRECVELAHAGDWSKTLPRYTEVLVSIAEANSKAQGKDAVEAWSEVDAALAGDVGALEESLNRWWRTFIQSK